MKALFFLASILVTFRRGKRDSALNFSNKRAIRRWKTKICSVRAKGGKNKPCDAVVETLNKKARFHRNFK